MSDDSRKISGMPEALPLSGNEWMELIQLDQDQIYQNRKVKVIDLQGPIGPRGKNAYELAKLKGFRGTISEFIDSLRGEDGEKGDPGEPGQSGPEGRSAYEEALSEGFSGSRQEWLKSLRGKDGASAYELAVDQGYQGSLQEWVESIRGIRGLSAYELAIEQGYEGSLQQWLESLKGRDGADGQNGQDGADGRDGEKGASAYQLAVEHGFQGTAEQWIASLKGQDGRSAYAVAVEAGYPDDAPKFAQDLATIHQRATQYFGAVYVTGIEVLDDNETVSKIDYVDNAYSVSQIDTTATRLRVYVTALSGVKKLEPVITVNGAQLDLTRAGTTTQFEGVIDVDVIDSQVEVVHDEGPVWRVFVKPLGQPVVSHTEIVKGYPSTQIELKEDDALDIAVEANTLIKYAKVNAYGALKSDAFVFEQPASRQVLLGCRVADKGNQKSTQTYQIAVAGDDQVYSEWFTASSISNVDNVHTVTLNNLYPTLTLDRVVYPNGQSAVKRDQVVKLEHTLTDYTNILYDNEALYIANPTNYNSPKEFKYIGDQQGRFTVDVIASRSDNGSQVTRQFDIHVFNEKPSVSFLCETEKLKSSPEGKVYDVRLESNQPLSEITRLDPPSGEWVNAEWTPNADKTVWSNQLRIRDTDLKGEVRITSIDLLAGNGERVTTLEGNDAYTVAGFTRRTLTVDAYPNRKADLGTAVYDVANLRCTNLSKSPSGTDNAVYVSRLVDQENAYTIVDDTLTANSKGRYWYNLDVDNAVANTSGILKIEIEEVV